MRTSRILARLGLTAAAVALTAGPAAAMTTPDPDIKSFPGGLTCSGDVVSGMVRVYSSTGGEFPGRVELRSNAGGRVFTESSLVQGFTVKSKGTRDYYFTFDVSEVPAGTTNFVGYAVVGDPAAPIDTLQSKVLAASTCAPAEVIPEAPSAVLIPLTLAATAGAVVALRRRTAGTPATA